MNQDEPKLTDPTPVVDGADDSAVPVPELAPARKPFRTRGMEKFQARSQVEIRIFTQAEISEAARRAMSRAQRGGSRIRWREARRRGLEWLMRMHYPRVFGKLDAYMVPKPEAK